MLEDNMGTFGTSQGEGDNARDSTTTLPVTSNNPYRGGTREPPNFQQLSRVGGSSSLRRVTPVSGFGSTLDSLFNKSSSIQIGDRFVVAKASRDEVEQTIGALRDRFEIAAVEDAQQLFGELLVYFGDNSTSTQTPSRRPYVFRNKVVPMDELYACFIPDPRRVWRALADVTKNFLEEHPGFMFHWAEMHGFPPQYRVYGFDTSDFCTNIPRDARKAVQAAKDAALNRSEFNLMRADLKAVGSGAGTVVKQQVGDMFATNTAAGRHSTSSS